MQALANPDKYGETGTYEKHLTKNGKANGDVDKETAGLTANDALFIQEFLLKKRTTLKPVSKIQGFQEVGGSTIS